MDSVLFSIVVPTRNRARTLQACLKTCLNQIEAPPYEIVINDNSDNDETRDLVASLIAENPDQTSIHYYKRESVCSMSENFEDAIGRASGQYVIVIGDDDGICPMALHELGLLIEKTGAQIIKWSNGLFNWPDIEYQNSANYLGFSLQRHFRVANGHEELQKSLIDLNYVNLPMLYINAAVRQNVINHIRDGQGGLFRSRSPDVYSSIVLSYHCGQFLDVSIPFTIAGLSGSSNGVSTAFAGDNPTPRQDFSALNVKAGLLKHPHVPDLTIYPAVDFAESFYFAKRYHFSLDDEFTLSRKRLLRACVERSDASDPAARKELLQACSDDAYLSEYVASLLDQPRTVTEAPKLKPANLGADGANLHLDTREFGIRTIEDAVNLVHKVVWPANAPLRYDLAR